ncbi:MAG: transcription elongation factor GreAB [Eubacteriales bacterium]
MNKKIIVIPLLIIIAGLILAYNGSYFFKAYNENANLIKDAALYTKEPLKIGIIGDIPSINEKIIEFDQIQFEDIENDDFNSKYDAILISKDNLSEAAQDKYAKVYKAAEIPFFFIGSIKGTAPFTEVNLSYEDAPLMSANTLFEGIAYTTKGGASWTSTTNVPNPSMEKNNYTNIFQTIYNNKYSK